MGWMVLALGRWSMSKPRIQKTASASSSEWLSKAQGEEGEGKNESRSQNEPRLSPPGIMRWGRRKLAFTLALHGISVEWLGAIWSWHGFCQRAQPPFVFVGWWEHSKTGLSWVFYDSGHISKSLYCTFIINEFYGTQIIPQESCLKKKKKNPTSPLLVVNSWIAQWHFIWNWTIALLK